MLTHWTVVPAVTVRVAGVNAEPCMNTWSAAGVTTGVVTDVLEQAAATRINPNNRAFTMASLPFPNASRQVDSLP